MVQWESEVRKLVTSDNNVDWEEAERGLQDSRNTLYFDDDSYTDV